MSESENHPINTALEESLEDAFAGRASAIESFFSAFIDGPLYVPRRYQTQPMSDSPTYPNDFVDVLGIQDDDRVVVPVFSNPEAIESWCGNKLNFRPLSGQETASTTPEDWWLVVNPGSDVEKELSPWEVVRLKDGKTAIPELLSEAMADVAVNPMHIRPLADDEHQELLTGLTDHAKADERITAIYTLVEAADEPAEESISTLLIGIVLKSDVPGGDFSTIQDEIDARVAPHLIGGQSKKIFLGYDINKSVMLGIFKGCDPVFTRSGRTGISLIKKLFRRS